MAGIVVRLDRNGKLVMRAAKKPAAALIEHLREHAAFLEAKAAAERAEARLTVDAKANASGPGGGRAAIGFGICHRCGKPPTKGNELIAEGSTMTVHERCYWGRGRPRYQPKTVGDGAIADKPDELLVPIPGGRSWRT
jgi:hypothetical protein